MIRSLWNRVRSAIEWRWRRFHDLRFDRRYGIETTEVETAYLDELDHENRDALEYYEGADWKSFRQLVEALPEPVEGFTFLDAGSGKGRALFFATRFGFKRIIGVEISPSLAEVAERNLTNFNAKTGREHPIELVQSDILDYEFPAEPLIAFLYNPFTGEVLTRFLDKLAEHCKQTGKPAYVIYMVAACRELVDEHPAYRECASATGCPIYICEASAGEIE